MTIDTINDGGPAFPHPSGWRRDPDISDGIRIALAQAKDKL